MNHSHDVWVSWKKITAPSTWDTMKNTAFALTQEPGRLHSLQSDNAISYYDRVRHGLRDDSWINYTSKFFITLERRVVVWLDSGHGIFCFAFTSRSADSSAVFWYLQNQMGDGNFLALSPLTINLSDILAPASYLHLLIGGEVTTFEAGTALKNYIDAKDHEDNGDSIPSKGFESIILNLGGQEATLYPNQLLLHAVPHIPDAQVFIWCKGIANTFLNLIAPFLEKETS